ncbi:uncharacterized protein LOC128952487 [Oppia nitens]|uniref:uncharacterized protein LOC128952487 n=1 Tax=Oppia nitens TaxID=1686743 RepID=UPI0023D9F79E|nr:uncharacterized protein LOC128952487 [Oppia nitens]
MLLAIRGLREFERVFKDDPGFKKLSKKYGRQAVRFVLCMGWRWARHCARSTLICGAAGEPLNCIRLAYCGGKTTRHCLDVFNTTNTVSTTNILDPTNYNPLEAIFLSDKDNRTVIQRAMDSRNRREIFNLLVLAAIG